MWYGRHITDRGDGKARGLERTQSRFPARARSCNLDFESSHAMLLRLLGSILSRHLRRIRGRFPRAFETHGPGRRPGNRVSLGIRDRDHGIVETCVYMRDAGSDVLAFAPTNAGGFFTHSISFRGSA